MIHAGIDIGSRTVKLVLIESDKIIFSQVIDNSFNTLEVCRDLLKDKNYQTITATGYGRHFISDYFKTEVISEIKAFSIGIKHLFPTTKTILDIGGQDTKAISLDSNGNVKKFEMNDKCAAGTGRFMEIMSMALRYRLDEFAEAAISTNEKENISSMCTVFAESEVVSMLAKGYDRSKIARGIHCSIINRSISLLKRVGIEDEIAFVGGVAKNEAMRTLLQETLNMKVNTPSDPQITGALGCAIWGARMEQIN